MYKVTNVYGSAIRFVGNGGRMVYLEPGESVVIDGIPDVNKDYVSIEKIDEEVKETKKIKSKKVR